MWISWWERPTINKQYTDRVEADGGLTIYLYAHYLYLCCVCQTSCVITVVVSVLNNNSLVIFKFMGDNKLCSGDIRECYGNTSTIQKVTHVLVWHC